MNMIKKDNGFDIFILLKLIWDEKKYLYFFLLYQLFCQFSCGKILKLPIVTQLHMLMIFINLSKIYGKIIVIKDVKIKFTQIFY